MTIFEKLKQGMLEEIIVKVCDFLIKDCDTCPKFISSRCKESCNEMRLRRLRTEEKIMANLEKLKQGMFDDMNDEANTPDDAPKDIPRGWIKLRTPKSAIYIDASKIVGLGAPNTAVVPDELRTTVYTIGAEDNPWIVCDRIDEVMEKIKKASQEK